jgi:uncharacterized protein (TIGR02466 family)
MPASLSTLFVTKLYTARLARPRALNAALEKTCLGLAKDDKAGARWSREHDYCGYTSYASLNDLTRRASVFAELQEQLEKHAEVFVRALDFDMAGKRLALDSLWVNVMREDAVHTAHIHPHAAISGTYYVSVPKGAAPIQFEDPRLGMMMAAPVKKKSARPENQTFVRVQPKAGTLLLWESFLRHKVTRNKARGTRISISFNYRVD